MITKARMTTTPATIPIIPPVLRSLPPPFPARELPFVAGRMVAELVRGVGRPRVGRGGSVVVTTRLVREAMDCESVALRLPLLDKVELLSMLIETGMRGTIEDLEPGIKLILLLPETGDEDSWVDVVLPLSDVEDLVVVGVADAVLGSTAFLLFMRFLDWSASAYLM